MKKHAFTLAEVLITLLIIGIIAAITIPSMIHEYEQHEFKTGLRKAISVLNDAIQLNISQDGESPYENGDLFNYLQRHMNIIKTREVHTSRINGTASDPTNCRSCMTYKNNIFYTTDGMRYEFVGTLNQGTNPELKAYLHESGLNAFQEKFKPGIGSSSMWHNQGEYSFAGFCGSYGLPKNPNKTTNTPCIVTVDVNGDRKPNPPISFVDPTVTHHTYFDYNRNAYTSWDEISHYTHSFDYIVSKISGNEFSDIFSVMITDREAIPFGVMAQRAMYAK